MPVYTNFVCEVAAKCHDQDHSREPLCKSAWAMNFDSTEETWGSMLEFAKSHGWRIEGGPEQSLTKCWCPTHAVEVVTDEAVGETGGEGCSVCGASEVSANTPRTVYACGGSDYDRRPGTITCPQELKP